MGCCLSTRKPITSLQNPERISDRAHARKNLALPPPPPPPPPQEEETVVKEVVTSEKPAPLLKHPHPSSNLLRCSKSKAISSQDLIGPNPSLTSQRAEEDNEVTGFYDLASTASASASTSTETRSTIATASTAMLSMGRRGDEDSVKGMSDKLERPTVPAKVAMKRVYSGDVPGGKDARTRALAKRPIPMPPQKRTTDSVGLRKGSSGIRRATAEGVGGRLKLPATGDAGGGGERVTVEMSSAVSMRRRVPLVDADKSGGGVEAGKQDGGVFSTTAMGSESIENPLVSLECFIFL
ncbi:hypothetical protein Dimus_009591 [Dionaea muscipula]